MTKVTKVILNIINVVSAILGLATAVASIWYFIQLHEFTSLRNPNHYKLDYTVYWPQAVPWIFFIVAVFVMILSCCGFTSVSKNNRNLFIMYVIFLTIVIACLIAAAVLALILADDKSTAEYVKDIAWDGFYHMKTDDKVSKAFEVWERKLHCCGVFGPRDYKIWKDEFPMSCCDGYNHGWLEPYVSDCSFTNKLANERHGCAAVAAHYAGITTKVLSGVSILTAIIAMITLGAAVLHYPEL